ncbi:hypothetical protein E2C01_016705 [Portunus trituberculatus]|uniref:Uncharacterized protein n=1 Tax=Portunus trituberculatus TaxID=210409 RepID=A0A5B7DRX1_PORTR|nr:hypothetical protein [Portunus trituberculatus]
MQHAPLLDRAPYIRCGQHCVLLHRRKGHSKKASPLPTSQDVRFPFYPSLVSSALDDVGWNFSLLNSAAAATTTTPGSGGEGVEGGSGERYGVNRRWVGVWRDGQGISEVRVGKNDRLKSESARRRFLAQENFVDSS